MIVYLICIGHKKDLIETFCIVNFSIKEQKIHYFLNLIETFCIVNNHLVQWEMTQHLI